MKMPVGQREDVRRYGDRDTSPPSIDLSLKPGLQMSRELGLLSITKPSITRLAISASFLIKLIPLSEQKASAI